MKKFLATILFLLLGIGIETGGARAEPVYVAKCSGTYIGNGYVLTAGHCTDQPGVELFVAKSNPELDEPGTETEKFTAKLVWTTNARDFGLIRLDKALVKRGKTERDEDPDKGKFKEEAIKNIPFTATKISCTVPRVKDKLTVKGWPAGEYVEVEAVVASVPRKIGEWPVAQWVASPGFFGSSGSGALNADGEVEAVVVGMIRGSGLMIFVPTSTICDILPRDLR